MECKIVRLYDVGDRKVSAPKASTSSAFPAPV